MTDFLIHIQSNAAAEIANFQRLQAVVLRTQQLINQTNAASSRAAGAGGGIGALGGLSAAGVGAVSPQVDRLTKSLGGLQSQMRAVSSVGIAPTLAQTRREMTLLQQITQAGGPSFGRYNSAAAAATSTLGGFNPAAQASAQNLIAQRAALDNTSAAFQRHAGRISETILLYAAFAAAATAAVSAVSLATTIDTESRRLEAVLGLTPSQGAEFVSGIGQVAISTATPLEDLLSESDLVASAFADVEDAAAREANSLELLNRVGQITTVTQRDVATETQNLIAIMNLGGVAVGDLGGVLGQVVAAGNNSSTSIAAILDAMNIALPGAKLAGVTIEQLIALTGQFRAETQRSGSEIGNTFKTLFQTITQPEAQKNISDLTDGMVELRDSEGNLRPVVEILLQIKTLFNEGVISAGRLNDIFKAFAPPLNPGAAKDVAILFDLIDELPAALREVESAGDAALNGLVEKLNAALGPQFRILIEQIKVGFNELFGEEIISSGQSLIDMIRFLGDVINALPPELVVFVGKVLALTLAFKGLMFVGGSLLGLLGVGGIATSAATGAAGLTGMAAAASALRGALLKVLPIALAVAAVEIGGNLVEDSQKSQILADLDIPEGQRQLVTALSSQARFGRDSTTANISAGQLDEGINIPQAENLNRLATAIGQMRQAGQSTSESEDAMAASIRNANGAISDQLISIEDIIVAGSGVVAGNSEQADSIEELIAQYQRQAEASLGVGEAARIEAETAKLLEATRGQQAADLEKLGERLRTGKIDAAEFAQGQQIVAQAAELAAQLVATAGGKLAEYPLFAEAAAEGNEKLTQRVYDLIVASGGSIGAIGGLIGQLGSLAAANAAAATSIFNNPIIIRVIKSSTVLGNNPELLKIGGGKTSNAVMKGAGNANAAAEAQANAILDSINSLVGGFGAGSPAFGNVPSGGGAAAGPKTKPTKVIPEPSLVDIGDLPPEMLAQAIALATKLQNAIPGAKGRAKDDILNIISDARFLRTVKGLDDALLRKAIDQLTEVEKARLEEEKRKNAANDLLSNLNVRAGPLGALISQPTLFGVGGSIPAGLNADPTKGNFTINIPMELQGLNPAKLQEQIYQQVLRAVREGLRLSGGIS